MLCLTRKVRESITIADNVVVTVLEIQGNRVRLGIAAPSAVGVMRTEKWSERHDEPPTIPMAPLRQQIETRKRERVSA